MRPSALDYDEMMMMMMMMGLVWGKREEKGKEASY
jgi:hypothetical protein